ncbi:MAG: ATP-binding protein [Erysipelotrichaceae bacterium]
MKSFLNWVKNLSLMQQLSIIVFVYIGIFSLLFFGFINKEIENFAMQRVFSTLKIAQQEVIYNYETQEDFYSVISGSVQDNTIHIIFDDGNITENFGDLTLSSNLKENIIEHLSSNNNYTTYISDVDNIRYYVSIERRSEYTVVSVASDIFANHLNSSFISGVVNIALVILVILFFVLFTWVTSIIYPINNLKVYIDNIRNGKDSKLNINRGDEIGMLAESVVNMNNELDKQERVKMEMFHNISHDFKTPIATIKSYAESIKDGVYPYDTLEKSVDVIYDNAERLERKVHSLLLINRFGYMLDESAEWESVRMKEIVEKVLLDNMATSKQVLLNVALEDIYYEGNAESWRIVVENILDNALRYARARIDISLSVDGTLIIKNDGEPIDELTLDKMFRPYEKGNDGQFGLGLSIVKRVCNVYDYDVTAYNEDGWVVFKISDNKMRDEELVKKKWSNK